MPDGPPGTSNSVQFSSAAPVAFGGSLVHSLNVFIALGGRDAEVRPRRDGDTGDGDAGGGLSFWAQTRSSFIPQPAFAPQLSSSSVTVQSLAPAVLQVLSASVKFACLLHSEKGPVADFNLAPTHTEQPGSFQLLFQPGSWVSEQHFTWSRAAGHGQHARKRATGWMRCKRTANSPSSSLGPGIAASHLSWFSGRVDPHTTGAVGDGLDGGGEGRGGEGDEGGDAGGSGGGGDGLGVEGDGDGGGGEGGDDGGSGGGGDGGGGEGDGGEGEGGGEGGLGLGLGKEGGLGFAFKSVQGEVPLGSNTVEPGRPSRATSYTPACGTSTVILNEDGFDLKKTSLVDGSTPTAESSVGAKGARATTPGRSHGGDDGGDDGGSGGGGDGLGVEGDGDGGGGEGGGDGGSGGGGDDGGCDGDGDAAGPKSRTAA